jgi:hypothetical protein
MSSSIGKFVSESWITINNTFSSVDEAVLPGKTLRQINNKIKRVKKM